MRDKIMEILFNHGEPAGGDGINAVFKSQHESITDEILNVLPNNNVIAARLFRVYVVNKSYNLSANLELVDVDDYFNWLGKEE